MPEPGGDGIAAIIASRLRADRVPGLSIAVIAGQELRWGAGFGLADLASRTPAEPGTPYLWFSMTKIATATAVLQLADEGRLDLDDPVSQHYPPFETVVTSQRITVRHLLAHSSGLANPIPIRWVYPAGSQPPDRSLFVRELLRRYRRLRSAPGERTKYSNLGYLVLGEVVSYVAGRPYEEVVHDRILAPLRMTDTGFSYQDTGRCRPATGYQTLPAVLTPLLRAALPSGIVAGRVGPYVAYRPFYVTGAAYGGLVGPVPDAARLAMLHLNDGTIDGVRVLSSSAVTAMRQICVRGGPIDVGLGWYRPHGAAGFVEHLGGGSGFFSVTRLYPDRGLGVVAMANTTRYDYSSVLDAIAKRQW